MRTSLVSGIAAGFVLVVASACGGSGGTPAPASQAAPASVAAAAPTCSQGLATGQQVGIADFQFTPGSLSVASGSTVTWTNADSATHTVTFDTGPDCGNLATGQSATATFAGAGTYAYHCKIHTNMKGTVTVS